MEYIKPNLFYYKIVQAASWLVAKLVFRRKILRNEIKEAQGPFVVIANHEAALDFVNLIGLTPRRMSFVISNSFYSTLPIKGILQKLGVIPKQQFQTTAADMKRIKTVIKKGEPLVIYPAGLMSEDGLSTPIPSATYKFLKWLGADIYAAKVSGTYFTMPKWSSGIRPGRTSIDVYKLFSKDDLKNSEVSDIKEKVDEALLFDAYRDQENMLVKYSGNNNINGLENVLYMCPHCLTEFSMEVRNNNILHCRECGYEQTSDEYAFLHNTSGKGPELRYVSDWSKLIYNDLKYKIEHGMEYGLFSKIKIHMIDHKKHKFKEVGEGILSLTKNCFSIKGIINGSNAEISVPTSVTPTLPFKPGRHIEIQQGSIIYRCLPQDGRLVMKFINMLKIFFTINNASTQDF